MDSSKDPAVAFYSKRVTVAPGMGTPVCWDHTMPKRRLGIGMLHDSVKARKPRIQAEAGNIQVGRLDGQRLLMLYDRKSEIFLEYEREITTLQ